MGGCHSEECDRIAKKYGHGLLAITFGYLPRILIIIIIMLRISHSIVQTKLSCELHQYCNI